MRAKILRTCTVSCLPGSTVIVTEAQFLALGNAAEAVEQPQGANLTARILKSRTVACLPGSIVEISAQQFLLLGFAAIKVDSEEPGQQGDQPGQDIPGSGGGSGQETPGSGGNSGQDTPGQQEEQPGQDTPGGGETGQDTPSQREEQPGQDTPGSGGGSGAGEDPAQESDSPGAVLQISVENAEGEVTVRKRRGRKKAQ